MLEHTRVAIARLAVGMGVTAAMLAALLWMSAVRAKVPAGTLGILSAVALWTPVALLALYTVVSQTQSFRGPVTLGRRSGDAWILVTALCIFALGFWRDLAPFATRPFPLSLGAGRIFEFIAFAALITRMIQLHRQQPGNPTTGGRSS